MVEMGLVARRAPCWDLLMVAGDRVNGYGEGNIARLHGDRIGMVPLCVWLIWVWNRCDRIWKS